VSENPRLLPIDALDEGALIRDRTLLDEEALAELKASIAVRGLRMPIEVFALTEAKDGRTHGLISGLRRLTAVRALYAETGEERWATIPTFVREPADVAQAVAEMVEENEVRADVSPWERGSFVVAARNAGVFATVEEAVDRLHGAAYPTKRSRIRAYARVAEELNGDFGAPERLSHEEIMRLAAAIRAGFGEDLRLALAEEPMADHGSQWRAVLPVLAEAEGKAPGPDAGGARRVMHIARGLTLRREKVKGGFLVRVTGREAGGALVREVLDGVVLAVTAGGGLVGGTR
jgi:ParB family chromosome partitioning protein